jgi:hypothetical protein
MFTFAEGLYIFGGAVVGFIGGCIGMFLFIRNNKKYLNVDALLQSQRDAAVAKIKQSILDAVK